MLYMRENIGLVKGLLLHSSRKQVTFSQRIPFNMVVVCDNEVFIAYSFDTAEHASDVT